ncbi:solute carrier family 2, facilitated glucose transporter member 1-like [Tribolium madens]|uniref:solute carrier family 2, facilitated glucose transporter member 1-like n=1 Tax=Tribolium madens TaxID=41895 RepID=UPI001CF736E7|nr:solute carrier family 2, facilitated glucose transporter member 1-like [Tribolium madens]
MVRVKHHLERIFSVSCSKFIFAVIIASLSGFQHGYHTGIVNIPAEVLQEWIRDIVINRTGEPASDNYIMVLWSTIVAIFSLGGIVGGALTNLFAEKFGRRNSLLWSNVLALLGIVFLIYSKVSDCYELLIVGRFIAGVNAGLNSGLCQIYLIEIAPDKIRGFVGGFYQLVIATSILISQVIGMKLGDEEQWPFMFLIGFIPVCLQLCLLPLCPESPKYLLITKGDKEGAEAALVWFRGTNNVYKEMYKLKEEDNLHKHVNDVNLSKLLCDISLRSRLAVSLILNIGQQLCGINALIYFSNGIFSDMGMSERVATYTTIAMGVVNVVVTLLGILFVDCIGRRIVLLIGFLGMGLSTLLLAIVLNLGKIASFMDYIATVLVFAFVILFAMGVGTIPWFLTGEIFNHTPRSFAVTITVSSNWLFNFVVAQTFLPLQSVIGNYAFLVFVVFDCLFYFFTVLHLPETARRSAKEIFEIYYE